MAQEEERWRCGAETATTGSAYSCGVRYALDKCAAAGLNGRHPRSRAWPRDRTALPKAMQESAVSAVSYGPDPDDLALVRPLKLCKQFALGQGDEMPVQHSGVSQPSGRRRLDATCTGFDKERWTISNAMPRATESYCRPAGDTGRGRALYI